MLQPVNRQNYTTPSIKARNVKLKVVDIHGYLGSVLSLMMTSAPNLVKPVLHLEG